MNYKLFNTLHLCSLGLALIGLLFPIKLSSLLVGIFALFSIVKLLIFKNKLEPKQNKTVFVYAGFYLLYLVGLLYTENIKVAQGLLERNLTWLLAPILIFFTIDVSRKQRKNLLLSFAFATQVFALFYLINSLYRYFTTNNSEELYNKAFTSFTEFHPVYFAMYLLFSMIILIDYLSKKNKLLFIAFLLFNTVILILLSSKTVLIVYLIFVCYHAFNYLKKKKKLIIFPLFIVGLLVFMFSFPTTKERINDAIFSKWDLLKKDTFVYNDAFTGSTLRLITWKFVTKKQLQENNYFIGTGTGDAQDFINSVYKEHEMVDAGYLGFNMHNQFLQYLVRFGLVGLLYFLLILVLSFKKSNKNKDIIYWWFLLIFCLASLTESTLEVHRGTVYFALFNSLFFFNSYSTKINY